MLYDQYHPRRADVDPYEDITVPHRCRGSAVTTGERCKRTVGPGELVCYRHGGRTPSTKRKALERRNEYEARKTLMRQGNHATIEDAVEELERIAAEAIAFKDICRERLDKLKDQIRYDHRAGEQLRSEVALYERALDRCDKILTNYVRLGIADKRVKIAEAQALMLVGVIQNILGRLDLSRDQKRIAATVVPEELRAISGPKDE